MSPTTSRRTPSSVLAQTWADGRYECSQATTVAHRTIAVARLGAALVRAAALVTVADSQRAIHTPLVRRWLVASVSLALVLWLDVIFRLGRYHPAYLVDLGQLHLLVMLPVLAVLAFARRRDADTALLGPVAVVEAVVLVWLLLLLPLGMATRYVAFYGGRVYVLPPVAILTSWLLTTAAASTAMLVVSSRVIRHPRRPFLTCLAFLLPVLASIGVMELYDRWQPALIHFRIGRWELMIAATVSCLGLLYAGLVWDARTGGTFGRDANERPEPS